MEFVQMMTTRYPSRGRSNYLTPLERRRSARTPSPQRTQRFHKV